MWGDEQSEFDLIERSFLICAILFLTACAVIAINIVMDIGFSDERFCQRGFLFHAPICIVILYSIMALCVLVPWIVGGGDNVTCSEDIDGVQTFGSLVPLMIYRLY